MKVSSYVLGKWIEGEGVETVLYNAVDGREIGTCSTQGFDFNAILNYSLNIFYCL